jgi:RNA polymerase sigma factor (sigma-70 family)
MGTGGEAFLGVLRRAFSAGAAAHPGVVLGFDEFAGRFGSLIRGRVVGLGLDPTPDRLAAWAERAAHADLYLAIAAALGAPGAWDRLARLLRPRLRGLALKRGARDPSADTLAADVLADMALPASKGAAGPLIGTYAGSGSLFGWAAVLLVRRLSRAGRRAAASLDADDAPEPASRSVPDPGGSAEDAEETRRFETAFAEAWIGLSPRERLALAWKHRDGLAQRDIGRLLRLGESRVSRVVAAAQARLRESLRGRLATLEGPAPGERLWGLLAAAVARGLARDPGTIPHPSRGPSIGPPSVP